MPDPPPSEEPETSSHRDTPRAEAPANHLETTSEAEWQAMVDTVPVALLYLDPKGRILRANRLAEEWIDDARSLDALTPGQPWEATLHLRDLVLTTGANDFMEVADPSDGRAWEVQVAQVETDSPGSVVVALRDITDRIRLENKLRRLDRLSSLGSLVHGISHTVRSSLFGLTGLVDVLRARIGDDAELHHFLDLQLVQSRHIVDLLDRVMQFGGPTKPNRTPGHLGPVLEHALAEARGRMDDESTVETKIVLDPSLPHLVMDRDRLALAISHVIQNALEHSPEGGEVHIRGCSETQGDRQWVRLEVNDQGPGISGKDLPRVFEPFFSQGNGHGLGLPTARRILEDHGGRLEMERPEEGGWRAIVLLPVLTAPATWRTTE